MSTKPRRTLPWRTRAARNTQPTNQPESLTEPTIRHLELIIAACGAVLALATVVTSYMQYRVAEVQTAIAEATLSPQFTVAFKAVSSPSEREKIEINNEGGPASNLRVTLLPYLDVRYFDIKRPKIEDWTSPDADKNKKLVIQSLWSAPIYSGSARGVVATITAGDASHVLVPLMKSALLSAVLPTHFYTQVRLITAIGVEYETPLGAARTDHFLISDQTVQKYQGADAIQLWSKAIPVYQEAQHFDPDSSSIAPPINEQAANWLSHNITKMVPAEMSSAIAEPAVASKLAQPKHSTPASSSR